MSNTTRCKLQLISKTPSYDGSLISLAFIAQYKPEKDPEDAIYGEYTPAASFNASIVTAQAEKFEVGKSYYFDISEAPAQEVV